jgi:hypothetical protein
MMMQVAVVQILGLSVAGMVGIRVSSKGMPRDRRHPVGAIAAGCRVLIGRTLPRWDDFRRPTTSSRAGTKDTTLQWPRVKMRVGCTAAWRQR